MSGTLNKNRITMELTRKLVELDQVAEEDEDIIGRFEKQHDVLTILVNKAKVRLMQYKPIRSALHAPVKHVLADIDVKQMIEDKAKNIEGYGPDNKFGQFMDHKSIKFQGDLFNPKTQRSRVIQNIQSQSNKENEINSANQHEDTYSNSSTSPKKDNKKSKISQGANKVHVEPYVRLEDQTIRERVEKMKKRKFCVF